MRKLRHSFLNYPDTFEQIYFDNFYSAFPQDQQPQLFNSELREELRGVDAYANCMRYFPAKGSNGSSLNRLLYLDIKTYLVELLMKQDQMSMAASLESCLLRLFAVTRRASLLRYGRGCGINFLRGSAQF